MLGVPSKAPYLGTGWFKPMHSKKNISVNIDDFHSTFDLMTMYYTALTFDDSSSV